MAPSAASSAASSTGAATGAATIATDTAPWPDLPAPDADVAARMLWYPCVARWAPSKHNTQPWRFVVHSSSLEIWSDPTRSLPATDPARRELILSCGVALRHVEVAAAALGRRLSIDVLPEGGSNLLARVVEVGEAVATVHDRALLDAVPRRRTDRGPLDRTVLPPSLPFVLQSAALLDGASLRLVMSGGDRSTLAELVERADRLLVRHGEADVELSKWLREPQDARSDGVPRDRTRGAAASYRAEFVQRDFSGSPDAKPAPAAHAREGRDHPLLAVLCTGEDRAYDWLQAGRALGAVLLEATVAGANASFLNQPLEVAALRADLRNALHLPGEAQAILRLGVGAAVAATPRRPIEQIRFQV